MDSDLQAIREKLFNLLSSMDRKLDVLLERMDAAPIHLPEQISQPASQEVLLGAMESPALEMEPSNDKSQNHCLVSEVVQLDSSSVHGDLNNDASSLVHGNLSVGAVILGVPEYEVPQCNESIQSPAKELTPRVVDLVFTNITEKRLISGSLNQGLTRMKSESLEMKPQADSLINVFAEKDANPCVMLNNPNLTPETSYREDHPQNLNEGVTSLKGSGDSLVRFSMTGNDEADDKEIWALLPPAKPQWPMMLCSSSNPSVVLKGFHIDSQISDFGSEIEQVFGILYVCENAGLNQALQPFEVFRLWIEQLLGISCVCEIVGLNQTLQPFDPGGRSSSQIILNVPPTLKSDRIWCNRKENSICGVTYQSCFGEILLHEDPVVHVKRGVDIHRLCGLTALYANFPTVTGVTSSTAVFSCLTFALATLMNFHEDQGNTSCIIRQGLVSACHRLYDVTQSNNITVQIVKHRQEGPIMAWQEISLGYSCLPWLIPSLSSLIVAVTKRVEF